MIGIRNLVDRFTSSGADAKPTERRALPRLPNPFKRNWRKTVDNLTQKIANTERELAELEEQRADAALRAEAGDSGSEAATSELFNVHQKLNAARQRFSDLQAARGAARRNVEAEIDEAEAEARKKQAREIRAAHKRMVAAVEAVDAALDTAAAEIVKASDAATEITRAADTQTVGHLVHANVLGRLVDSISYRFRYFGMRTSPFMAESQVPLAQYVPPADALVERARPPKFDRPSDEPANDGEAAEVDDEAAASA